MNIGIDIMGGDYAPQQAIEGIAQYFENADNADVTLTLIGDSAIASPHLSLLDNYKWRYTFVESTELIGMHEHPTKALRDKPNSSISIGFRLMAEKRIDAFIGAGNTGAMMVGAMYAVKTIEGILRPVIASPVPRENGQFNLLLDVGVNADCKPEHLVQFAELGSLYLQHVVGIKQPKVGLLNIGEEEGKGNILTQATYPLLKQNQAINFVGNIEGRDVFLNKADIIVCEGFVGNVLLKSAESIYDIFAVQKGFKDDLLDRFNFEIYGGTPILGINEPVIIGHGISKALAFRNMIVVASKIVASNLMTAFKQHFAHQAEQKAEE